MVKEEKIQFENSEPSDVQLFRYKMLKQGYDLINITSLCEVKLGCSGWGNGFNEPDETIHHIQIYYRDEPVVNVHFNRFELLDEELYTLLEVNADDPIGSDFIIYAKVEISEERQDELMKVIEREIKVHKAINKKYGKNKK